MSNVVHFDEHGHEYPRCGARNAVYWSGNLAEQVQRRYQPRGIGRKQALE
ncbi:MAG: hypothetical protein ACRENL_00805 [Candidatus Dormibacteria bacterium]